MKFAHLNGILLAACIIFTIPAQAEEVPRYSLSGSEIHGGSADIAKAGADTINLMASHYDPTNGDGEPFYYGDFENVSGNADWNGWTHRDITQPTVTHWNVSTYNQPNPSNHAAWCGDINIPPCPWDQDPAGGYGNLWHDIIEFRQTVPNPGVGSTVTVTATLIHDSEPGYDYTYLSYGYQGQPYGDMESWTGVGTVAVSNSVSYQPQDYMAGTDIVVYFRFQSDGGFSDEDCYYPSAGGCQVDDINVHLVNGAFSADYFEDFEHGGVADDFGIWNVTFPPGVGDFANIWTGLEDLDPCFTNYTPQVAFIDDGIVVAGTGGSHCINWCYGPGGYIVTTTGGVAGPNEHIFNAVESPVMVWPGSRSGSGFDDGISLAFDVFEHEDLSADAPGIFYGWDVRSADTDGSAGNGVQDIAEQPWRRRTILLIGGPVYHRSGQDISDLMNPGRDEIQVRLTVNELGYMWGYTGNDGYPAPYFDNVTVKVYPFIGPAMYARELDLAQDNFPERGTIDYEDLGSLHVRFDMANNISLASHLRNDPGDSIVVDIALVRSGTGFTGDPELHYILDANPVFDPYRTSGLPEQGSVTGQPAVGVGGNSAPDKWAFDLPDTGFLFPGDVLHYYISATDAIGGMGGTDPRTALIPSDTTGFSHGLDYDFGNPLGYDQSFTVRALPSIREKRSGGYDQPIALFINDFANRDPGNTWYRALQNIDDEIPLVMDQIYDIYYVNAPSSGAGNGIGGRADAQTLENYWDILYTCGNLGWNTIANGDFQNDAGDDIGTLTNWLDLGGKDIFLAGDDLASDLAQSGDRTRAFLNDNLGISLVTNNIRPLISNQVTPLVEAIGGNPVFTGVLQTWVAYGGCIGINYFDGVEVLGTGQRLAEFLDPSGLSGQYTFSAATLNIMNPGPAQSRAISMPVDLMYVYTDQGAPFSPLSARDQLLYDVLRFLEVIPGPIGDVTPGVPDITFMTSNFPNPFNPRTTIKYSMPRAGHLKLCIYNVRGQLVKTLIDGPRPAGEGQVVVWDGTNAQGSSVASGTYFYEARALGDVRIGKTTLLK